MCVDVARPDKISGADINSICQEVSNTFTHLALTSVCVRERESLSHFRCRCFIPLRYYYCVCVLRLVCWLFVKTVISSWPRILRRLTRRSSRRMSRSTSSTSRDGDSSHRLSVAIFLYSAFICSYSHTHTVIFYASAPDTHMDCDLDGFKLARHCNFQTFYRLLYTAKMNQ